MERFKLLSDEELVRIDQASRALLRDMGTLVSNDEALYYYEKAGCHVDKSTGIVRVPDYVINETLAACSSWVRLYDRRGGKPMLIGGNDT
ncbi:trimethylamine methyltransferase family protein [Cloacibacillus evryensis]